MIRKTDKISQFNCKWNWFLPFSILS